MVRDSFSFVQELLNLNFNSSSVVMASFDVTSLFTNIPLDETIDIISNRVFANAVRFHGLTRCEFGKLLCFAVKNCHFLFNGVLYQQIDGVAMGSPLFANIFFSFHEKVWLSKCPADFKPLLQGVSKKSLQLENSRSANSHRCICYYYRTAFGN